jgi:protease-4
VFTGVKAKELGLIDEVGDLYDAIDEAGKLGDIQGIPDVQYLNQLVVTGSDLAASPANSTRTIGHYQPFYSPYGWMYL